MEEIEDKVKNTEEVPETLVARSKSEEYRPVRFRRVGERSKQANRIRKQSKKILIQSIVFVAFVVVVLLVIMRLLQ